MIIEVWAKICILFNRRKLGFFSIKINEFIFFLVVWAKIWILFNRKKRDSFKFEKNEAAPGGWTSERFYWFMSTLLSLYWFMSTLLSWSYWLLKLVPTSPNFETHKNLVLDRFPFAYVYTYTWSIYHIIFMSFKEPKSGPPPTTHHQNKIIISALKIQILI